MKTIMRKRLTRLAALFVLTAWPASAASLYFVPESSPNGLQFGDVITLQVWLDFSDVLDEGGAVVGTAGGGFNILWLSDFFRFVDLEYIPIGDPTFGMPPTYSDFSPGVLDFWAVGDFEGIIGPIMAGSFSLEVITQETFSSEIFFAPSSSIGGSPFVNAATFDVIDTDYGHITLTGVPAPAGAWLLLSSLGAMVGLARRPAAN